MRLKNRTAWPKVKVVVFTLLAVLAPLALPNDALPTDDPVPLSKSVKVKPMEKVSGEFDVKLISVDTADAQLGMMLLDKVYRGPLRGTGKGRMLTGMTSIKGSADMSLSNVSKENCSAKVAASSFSILERWPKAISR